MTTTRNQLAKGVKVLIPTRKTSKSEKELWEIKDTLRRYGHKLPYLTLDTVRELPEYPGEVQVNFLEYPLLSRFRPEDLGLYVEAPNQETPFTTYVGQINRLIRAQSEIIGSGQAALLTLSQMELPPAAQALVELAMEDMKQKLEAIKTLS